MIKVNTQNREQYHIDRTSFTNGSFSQTKDECGKGREAKETLPQATLIIKNPVIE